MGYICLGAASALGLSRKLAWGSPFLSVGFFSNICFLPLLRVDTQQKSLVLKFEVWGQLGSIDSTGGRNSGELFQGAWPGPDCVWVQGKVIISVLMMAW